MLKIQKLNYIGTFFSKKRGNKVQTKNLKSKQILNHDQFLTQREGGDMDTHTHTQPIQKHFLTF